MSANAIVPDVPNDVICALRGSPEFALLQDAPPSVDRYTPFEYVPARMVVPTTVSTLTTVSPSPEFTEVHTFMLLPDKKIPFPFVAAKIFVSSDVIDLTRVPAGKPESTFDHDVPRFDVR